MAKGQQRSNREARKPKKEKSAAKPDVPTFGSKMASASNATPPRGKATRQS
ncbi:hypothetical protein LC092_15275 [Stappia stellulata]|uniref:hypothetical protein n=1 Tax=Stappia TaxID=152161 RepID=UPI001CD7C1E7|nr:hypothetical protein [Stappia stellulata]MCA1243809.1 hypothetical protein [Stappia stellulata]